MSPAAIKKRLKSTVRKARSRYRKARRDLTDRLTHVEEVDTGIDISVVIPVYNCEEYVEQTIRSISEHTSCRFEIIAINDESPDNVLELLRRLETEIAQLIVHDQKNIGGANTLNRGLGMARGKYVTFLDCDDWLAPGALDTLFATAEKSGAQVAGGALQKYTDGLYDDIHDFAKYKTRQDIIVSNGIPASVLHDSFYTGKIFARAHLERNGIIFIPDLLYADRPFLTKSMVTARKVVLLPKIVGFWRKHPDGRSVTDGFRNPSNLIDKMTGFGWLLRDPEVVLRPEIRTTIFIEGLKRLWWNIDDADDLTFAPSFAYAARALVAGYPDYRTLPGNRMSLRQKLLFDQIANHEDAYFHDYKVALDRLVATGAGLPVAQLAVQMNALSHEGPPQTELPPFPVVKNPQMYVFESFFGKSFGGNPRYLYEELVRRGRPFTAVWVYSPSRRPFKLNPPDHVNLVQVARGSPQYYQALREARYWVNNIRFPEGIEKAPGTIYVQTWHGTPLKRLGLDIEATGPEAQARASFLEDASKWDYLLAQNTYSKDIFTRAFDVKCPILVEGYPANDVLADERKRARAAKFIRAKYHIPRDKKIVTYAPTWRDRDQVGDTWVFANRIALDFAALRKQLGDDYVVILRLHHLMARSVSFSGLEGFVYDGSKEPDANRLMAATDILVTDYSSIFFDYACSGKPMIFYMYDLEEYESELRGFYIDPREELPGPIVRTQDALVAAVKEAGSGPDAAHPRYPAFAQKFLSHDHGSSAKAVADRVFDIRSNLEDLDDLNDDRRARAQAAIRQARIDAGAWSEADYAYDVSLVTTKTGSDKVDMARINAWRDHGPARVQIILPSSIALPDAADDLLKSGDLIRTAPGERPVDKASGKFILHLADEAVWRPDTLSLLVSRAEAAEATIVMRRMTSPEPGKRATLLTEPDTLAQEGSFDDLRLDDVMVLTDFMRAAVDPDLPDGLVAQVLAARAERISVSDVFPYVPGRMKDGLADDPRVAIDLLCALGTDAHDQSARIFTRAFTRITEPLAEQDMDIARSLVAAWPKAFAFPDLPVMQADILTRIVPELADPMPLENAFSPVTGSQKDQLTFFFATGGSRPGPHIAQMAAQIAGEIKAARIIIENATPEFYEGWDMAPHVTLRPVMAGALDGVFWRARAATVLSSNPALAEMHDDADLVVTGTYHDLAALGWSQAVFLDDRLSKRPQSPGATLFTDPATYASWKDDRHFGGMNVHPVAPQRRSFLSDRDEADRVGRAWRLSQGIQQNRLLVGIIQIVRRDEEPERLIDAERLQSLLPVNTRVFVHDIADPEGMSGFLAACDVLVSPPHPAVADYAVTGKPIVPQDSFIAPATGRWKDAAADYETHDAIAAEITRVVQEGTTGFAVDILDSADDGLADKADLLREMIRKGRT